MTSFLCFVWHLLEIEGIDIAYVVNGIFIGCKKYFMEEKSFWKRYFIVSLTFRGADRRTANIIDSSEVYATQFRNRYGKVVLLLVVISMDGTNRKE